MQNEDENRFILIELKRIKKDISQRCVSLKANPEYSEFTE